ncbi:sugar kinase [Mariniluteicoccus flavus]
MAVTAEVVALGETMTLVVPDPVGPLATAATFALGTAGGESNVAQWLAALGHDTVWASRVGADPLGARMREAIARWGVRVLAADDPTAPTGLMVKDPAPSGTSVRYYRAGSAASRMSPGWLAGLGLTSRLVHTTGVTSALSEDCRAMVASLPDAVPGAVVSFDVNFRPRLWSASDAAPVLRAEAERADLLFVGRDEAATLWGTESAADVRTLFADACHLVVKDADVGAWEFHGDDAVFVESPTVDVVEPVGAGDAFAAGFLAGWLRGWAPERRLALGHRLAGLALRSPLDVPETALSPDFREEILR